MEHNKEQMAQMRAYLRNKMTKAQKMAFEKELSQNEKLSQVFAAEKEMFLLFQGYEEAEMEKAMQKMQEIERYFDRRAFYKKLAILACILALILASIGGYWCCNHNDNKEKITSLRPIDTTKQDTSNIFSKDSDSSSIQEERVLIPKPTEKAKDTFADSLKNYLAFAKSAEQEQNALISLLRNNVKLNLELIDTRNALWKCNHDKNGVSSIGPPKSYSTVDTLVLDSIYRFQSFPETPKDLHQIKMYQNMINKWKEMANYRIEAANRRFGKFQATYQGFISDLRKCQDK